MAQKGLLRRPRCPARIAISCRLCLAHHAPLPPKKFSTEVCARSPSYLHWLFEAKKRFGVSVLNYTVTCNHVHLLVKDTGPGVIANSIQLTAGRTGQEYNQRKARHWAFWEDRYHATAIEADEHLKSYLVYIDLNMVRAGVVRHPSQ